MSAPLGKMIYVDPSQFQKSVETRELRQFLSGAGIQDINGFQKRVETIFQTGSPRRSFIFMNMSFREFAPRQRGTGSSVPVFGVKGGIKGITRASNYSEIFTARPEDMRAGGFIRRVFGTSYMTEDEGIQESGQKAFSVLTRAENPVSVSVPDDMKDAAAVLMTQIWSALEKDPRTRIVLRVPDAENNSMKLLHAIYLLMPTSLRMQTGFATNITADELRQIGQGLPVSVMTADEDVNLNVAGLNLPVLEIDVANFSKLRPDPDRLKLVRGFAENVNDVTALLLDHADEMVRRQQNNAFPSFKYYGEALKASPDVMDLLSVDDELSGTRKELAKAQEAVRSEQNARKQLSGDFQKLQERHRQADAYIKRLQGDLTQRDQQLQQLQQMGDPRAANRKLKEYERQAAGRKRIIVIESILLVIAVIAVVFLLLSGRSSGNGSSSSNVSGTGQTVTTKKRATKKKADTASTAKTQEVAVPQASGSSTSSTNEEVTGTGQGTTSGTGTYGGQGTGAGTGTGTGTYGGQGSGTSGNGTGTGSGTGSDGINGGHGYGNDDNAVQYN